MVRSFEAQVQQHEEPGDGSDDTAVLEAQKAEQEAEELVMQAQRTWTEAQKATQALLRRDRSFGHVQPSKKKQWMLHLWKTSWIP